MPDIRDDNLRLIYAHQEAAHISAGLGKATRRLAVHGILLLLVAALWSSGQLTDEGSTPWQFGEHLKDGGHAARALALNVSIAAVALVLPAVSGICFLRALADLLKFRSFRKDYSAFLRHYNRAG